jgi:hypothetical protein
MAPRHQELSPGNDSIRAAPAAIHGFRDDFGATGDKRSVGGSRQLWRAGAQTFSPTANSDRAIDSKSVRRRIASSPT